MKQNILYIILTFIIGFSNIFAQESISSSSKKIDEIQASGGGTVEFNGQSNNLAKITQEIDNGGNEFGSLFFNAPIGIPSASMKHKLWMDNDGKLSFGNDPIGYGWLINGNMIQLKDPVNNFVTIGGSATFNNNTNVLQVLGVLTTNGFQMDNNGGVGKVLTSDANGVGTWQTPSGGGGAGSINGLSDGKSTPNSNSVYLGEGAGTNDDSKIGTQTLASMNTALGINALNKNGLVASDFGVKNTAIGFESLKNLDNNNADENTAVGYQSHFYNSSGYQNTALGNESMYGYSGGFGNTAIGYQSLKGGNNNSTGQYNVALGYGALMGNVSGNYNIAIGYKAGETLTGSDQLIIQNRQNAARDPLIWGSFAPSSVKVHINVNNIATRSERFYVNGSAGGTGAWINASDVRLKKNVTTLQNSLEKVNKLRGVNFEWKDTKNNRTGLQMGFIAQEAKEIIPEVVSDDDEYMSMQYAPITALLVEAVKEQQKIIENLKKEKAEIKNTNKNLEERLSKIESLLNDKKFAKINN
jgi:hypothetical protein